MKRTLARREDRASSSAKREKIIKATGPVLTRYGFRGLRVPGKSWVLLRGLVGEWPAEPDADVEDDAGSDEAEDGGGDPFVGGGPCPAIVAAAAVSLMT